MAALLKIFRALLAAWRTWREEERREARQRQIDEADIDFRIREAMREETKKIGEAGGDPATYRSAFERLRREQQGD